MATSYYNLMSIIEDDQKVVAVCGNDMRSMSWYDNDYDQPSLLWLPIYM